MASFGERLRKTRENRKITLEEVALATKIGTRMLRALEEERFDQLPGGIFNKGFVRAYARHLGIDEDKAVADYLEAAGELPVPEPEDLQLRAIAERREKEKQGRPPVAIPWGMLAVLLLLIALLLAVWGVYSRERNRSARPAGQSAIPAAATTPTTAPPAGAPEANAVPPVSADNSQAADNTGVQPASRPPEPTSTAPPTPVSSAPGLFFVVVRAHEDSWVSATADGKVVYNDLLAASGEKAIQARDRIVVRAGNVGGLDVFFDGRKLPPQGQRGEVKTLTFTAQGLEAEPAPTVPN